MPTSRLHSPFGHLLIRHGPCHFSVSTSPFTKSLCIKTTTATGGSMASTAVAMTICHSVSASCVDDHLLDADDDGLHVVAWS